MDPNDPMAHGDTTPGVTTGPSDDLMPAAEPAAQPAVIDVFADTGHHFAFVPLTSRQVHDNPDLERLCRNNDFPWCEARDRSGAPLRWLRYQFAQREVGGTPTDQSGVLLCLETNQGTARRGWVLQPEETVSSAEAAELTKILENTFRAVNIGLVNEIMMICDKLGFLLKRNTFSFLGKILKR